MRITILIPTLNEQENILPLLKDIYSKIKKLPKHKFSILIVDSHSKDKTIPLIKSFQKKHKNLHLIFDTQEGLGKAMCIGYQHAIKKLKAQAVITNEADFAFDFKHLPYMINRLNEGFDVVVGSRHVGIGKTEGWTLSRRLNHYTANKIFATWIAGVNQVYDHNGAFRAIRVKGVLDNIDFSCLPSKGFGFFFYSMYLLTELTDKIDEFPVIYRFRQKGESKVSFNKKYIKRYLRDVLEYMKLALLIRFQKTKKVLRI
jgi:glycosyltransferase involved in cell wall biosynthesis